MEIKFADISSSLVTYMMYGLQRRLHISVSSASGEYMSAGQGTLECSVNTAVSVFNKKCKISLIYVESLEDLLAWSHRIRKVLIALRERHKTLIIWG